MNGLELDFYDFVRKNYYEQIKLSRRTKLKEYSGAHKFYGNILVEMG